MSSDLNDTKNLSVIHLIFTSLIWLSYFFRFFSSVYTTMVVAWYLLLYTHTPYILLVEPNHQSLHYFWISVCVLHYELYKISSRSGGMHRCKLDIVYQSLKRYKCIWLWVIKLVYRIFETEHGRSSGCMYNNHGCLWWKQGYNFYCKIFKIGLINVCMYYRAYEGILILVEWNKGTT